MGVPVLILGESGTGKSASLRNFPAENVAVINVANKPLPFKNKLESTSTDDYTKVDICLTEYAKKYKSIVVDDAQYLMANEFMRRSTERGYDKFTDIAKNFWSLINAVKELPDDVIVYFMSHIDRDTEGHEKIKTIGKLLDEKITVEGMFTIVLKTNVTDGQYSFLTQNNGHDTAKSPIGMFPTYAIDNDLYYVDKKIRNYYEMGEFLTDEEMAELDEVNANANVTKESTSGKKTRRSRSKKKSEEDNAASPAKTESETKEKPKTRTRKKREEPEEVPFEGGPGVEAAEDNSESANAESETAEEPKETTGRHRRRRRA